MRNRPKTSYTLNLASGVCSICYSKGVTQIHHIVPVSFGGPDTVNNMVELCLSCHSLAHGFKAHWQDRAREGIAKAKAEGKYKGRRPTARAKTEDVLALHAKGVGAAEIARQLDIGRASVYRVFKDNCVDLSK